MTTNVDHETPPRSPLTSSTAAFSASNGQLAHDHDHDHDHDHESRITNHNRESASSVEQRYDCSARSRIRRASRLSGPQGSTSSVAASEAALATPLHNCAA